VSTPSKAEKANINGEMKMNAANKLNLRQMPNFALLGFLGEALMGDLPMKDKFPVAKPKQLSANPFRGYYSRHTSGLTEYFTEKKQAAIQNGLTKFVGFRKVRKFIPANGMSVWVKV
jgi:hypothetical protein